MKRFDTFAVHASTLEEARELVEPALGAPFSAHDSLYHGGAYFRADLGNDASAVLQRNQDPLTGKRTVATDAPFVLFINAANEPDRLRSTLQQTSVAIQHLRRDEVP